MVYDIFYKFRADPFRLSPDHRFGYEHKGYAKAKAYMAYAFSRKEGFVVITGSPGTGKTTLVGNLLEELASRHVNTVNLVSTQLQADDLLKIVAYKFGVDVRVTAKGELLQRLTLLFSTMHRSGRRALLVVDEAQDLSESALEELRLLTNISEDGNPLLQIFLLGQPELNDLLHRPGMEQVLQRVVAASHLKPLKAQETEAYIRHRLGRVGWHDDPTLSQAIYSIIFKYSGGVPRRINLICSRLFLHGSVEEKHQLGVLDLKRVIKELRDENLAISSDYAENDFAVHDYFKPSQAAPPEPAAPKEEELVLDWEESESVEAMTLPVDVSSGLAQRQPITAASAAAVSVAPTLNVVKTGSAKTVERKLPKQMPLESRSARPPGPSDSSPEPPAPQPVARATASFEARPSRQNPVVPPRSFGAANPQRRKRRAPGRLPGWVLVLVLAAVVAALSLTEPGGAVAGQILAVFRGLF